FATTLLEEAEHDMTGVELVLDTLTIQNVTDEENHLPSIGPIRSATVNHEQAIAQTEARADAAAQQAPNWARSQGAKLVADVVRAQQETQKRIADAISRREALIREARGEVSAQVAQVRAEIDKQRARALQEKR